MKTKFGRMTIVSVIAAASLIAAGSTGCNSGGMQGTYSDQNGAFVLDLKSGGHATFTLAGQTANCTYSTSGNELTLACEGETNKTVLTIHDDGSLTGPPGTFMPALRKTK